MQQLDLKDKNSSDRFEKLASVIAAVPRNESVQILIKHAAYQKQPVEYRKLAVRKLGDLYGGCKTMIQWAETGEYDKQLKPAMIAALYSARWNDVRNRAKKLFPLKATKDKAFPDIRQLIRRRGDRTRGQIVFTKAGTCATCHVVNGTGKTVGPDLSEIGRKLSKTAMYESILFPSASISHNYEMWRVTTTEGEIIDGVVVSDNNTATVLIDAKGNRQTFQAADIDEKVRQKVSIMPDNLHEKLTDRELVDLIEYLVSLKKAKK